MPTWTVITMPSTPAPKSVEIERSDSVAMAISPFTGDQQTQDWQWSNTAVNVTMPPMDMTTAGPWLTFLQAAHGQANVFLIPNAAFAAMLPGTTTGYWRMKANSVKWSINEANIVGIQFEMRQAQTQ